MLVSPFFLMTTTKPVHGASLVYVSQPGSSLPQSALLWEPAEPGGPVQLAKLHSSVFTLRLTLDPPKATCHAVQNKLSYFYKTQRVTCEDRIYSESHARDERYRLTMAELVQPIPDDRWLTVHPTSLPGVFNITCTHHGVYMGLIDFYLRKLVSSDDGTIVLWIDNTPYKAILAAQEARPLTCDYKDLAPSLAQEAVLSLFGRAQQIDAVSIALPAYPPRQSQGVPWFILDDYLIIPHVAQTMAASTGYAVHLPQTLYQTSETRADDGSTQITKERTLIRMERNVQILGLLCPLTRTLLHWNPTSPVQESQTPALPVLVQSKKRPREDESKSSYAAVQLKPKRLKSLANQIPFQLFLQNWTDPSRDVQSLLPVLAPDGPEDSPDLKTKRRAIYIKKREALCETIEAWCFLKQPRRQEMGEERVRLLAQQVLTSVGSIPIWFQSGIEEKKFK